MIPVGTAAPEFELRDQHGATTSLAALRGRPVVLVFYPFAFTGTCTGELRAVRDEVVPALGDDAVVLVVSCDTPFAQRVFAEQEGLDFPMLSDFWPHGAVASAFGVFDAERGCALRATFILDTEGVVRWSVVNALPDARDAGACVRAFGDLSLV